MPFPKCSPGRRTNEPSNSPFHCVPDRLRIHFLGFRAESIAALPSVLGLYHDPDRPLSKSRDNMPQHVPGSTASFTLAQVHDLYNPPDWHPNAHPPMPPIVAHGRPAEVFACGYCHLPNGQGRPENSRLAGLPAGYIIRQIADFKNGQRKCSEPRHAPVTDMIAIASKASDQEIKEAAAYFSSLERKPWIRVVEASTVPRTHVDGWMLVASEPAATEPIGPRIIEMAENLERTELRDDTSGFVAYVPEGSLKKGKELVTTGGSGRTVACAKCHGSGTSRDGKCSTDCRPFSQLSRPPTFRHSKRRANRSARATNAQTDCPTNPRRHHRNRRLHGLVTSLTPARFFCIQ